MPTVGLPSAAPVAVLDPPVSPQVSEPQRRSLGTLIGTARRLGSRAERADHAAAKEEQRISDELADLPAGWFVVASPQIDGLADDDCHLDYAVIGPAGVFLLHLEHHPAAKVWVSEHKVTIDGRDSDRLAKARFAARRSGTLLTEACGFDVIVQSVLVLIGAATVQRLSRPPEVHVRDQFDIRDWLCKQPARLDFDSASAIYRRIGAAEKAPSSPPIGLLE